MSNARWLWLHVIEALAVNLFFAFALPIVFDIEIWTVEYLLFAGTLTVLYFLWKQLILQSRFARFFPRGTVITRSTSARLELLDAEGKRARYSKLKEITTDANELAEFTETGIWSQGPLEDITASDNVRCTPREVLERPNHYDLDFELIKPLRKGQIREISMSWTMLDSFTNDTEFYTISASYPASKYTLRISFPEDRPVKDAWVDFTYMGKKTRLTDRNLHIDSRHREVLFTMNQVFPGMKAIIIWNW